MTPFKIKAARWATLAASCALLAATTNKPATQPAVISNRAYSDADKLDPPMAKLLEATPASLNVQNMPVMTALNELSKTSGYAIKPAYDGMFSRGRSGGNVSVSQTNQPFWVVFRDVATRGNINLYSWGNDENAINIAPSTYGGEGALKGPASIQGPFLTTVNDIERENTVVMSDPKKVTRTIHIRTQMYVEPKLKLEDVSYRPTIDEASDDNGNDMVPPEQNERGTEGNRGIAWWGQIDLPYPTTNPGTHIAKLKGRMSAKLQNPPTPSGRDINMPFELVNLPLP